MGLANLIHHMHGICNCDGRMLAMFGEVPVPSRTPATVKAASGTGVLLLAGLSDLELNGKVYDGWP